MPAAVVAIAAVVTSVAGSVVAAIAPIAAAIASAIAPAVAAIGSVIGAITGALSAAVAPIMSTAGGVANWVVTSVGQTAGSLVKTISDTATPLLRGVTDAIGKLAAGIDKATAPILEPIKGGLEIVKTKVEAVNRWVTTAFHPSARMTELKLAHPELWEAAEHVDSSFIALLESDMIVTSTEASLLALPDVIETISMVSTVKVLADLVKGQAGISELLGAISQGEAFKTAQAIALLTQNIATTTTGIMDKVDTDVGVLRASIDAFDERLKRSLQECAQQTRAEILNVVTPKQQVLGEHQLALERQIARLARHIEDEVWFGAMLLKILR